MRRAAFSLVELLTVIAILAVVIALVFSAVQQARETTRRVTCSSNLRQIGQATLIYLADYDERFPGGPGRFGLHLPGPEGRWDHMPTPCCGNMTRISVAVQLQAYLKSNEVLLCPNDPTGARYLAARDARIMRVGYGWGYGISQGASHPEYPSLRGGRVTAAPIHAMFLSAKGELPDGEAQVDWVPEPGKQYVVRGNMVPGSLTIWIEEAKGGPKVTPVLTLK